MKAHEAKERWVDVRVQPRAKKIHVEESPTGYKIYLNTPPVDGRANEAVIKILAEHLAISKSKVRIVRGLTSRDKVLAIQMEDPS
jgi:uncharacterized protein (TIGR00251 family)